MPLVTPDNEGRNQAGAFHLASPEVALAVDVVAGRPAMDARNSQPRNAISIVRA